MTDAIAVASQILLAHLQTADQSVQLIRIVLLKKPVLPVAVKIHVPVFVGLMPNVGCETTSQFAFAYLVILGTHSVNVACKQVRLKD